MAKKTTKSNKTSHVMNLLTSMPVSEEAELTENSEGGEGKKRNASVKGEKIELDETMLSDFHEAAEKTKQAAEHFDGAVSNFKTAVDSFDNMETRADAVTEEQDKQGEASVKEEPVPSKKSKVTVIDESSENDKITNEIQVNLEKKLLDEYDEPETEFHIKNEGCQRSDSEPRRMQL